MQVRHEAVFPAHRVEAVFAASLDTDVHLASLSGSREQLVRGPGRPGLRLGDEVTWRARYVGLWWTMTVAVTEVDAPRSFVDEQVRGPFAAMRHEHTFRAVGPGAVATDLMTVEVPLRRLGGRAAEPLLASLLSRVLRDREAGIRQALDARG